MSSSTEPPSRPPIRTLVVDDSAFARKAVREMLSGSPFIEVVGTARNGEEALDLVDELRPDVVTCDLLMPRLDGAGFVRRQMARRPLPILILTSSPADADLVLDALDAGAVDLVQKPTALATAALLDIRGQLLDKVKAAGGAPVANLAGPASVQPASASTAALKPFGGSRKFDVLVIGVSTGGPQALRFLLPRIPADFPIPIAMVLHMPIGYTALFAEKLNEISPLEIVEAKDGDPLRPGVVLLAPAGRHLALRREKDGQVRARLVLQPIDSVHRPAVDVLFQSAAEIFADRVLGLILTGMGDDGRLGAARIKARGGTVLTEAESSCVIYGMPRAVWEAGLSDAAVPLGSLAEAIFERL
ncbi:MAG: protein-glutamate methylesterase/protein-glutamine glutaminase [Opitutaceae bacterium]